MTFNIGSQNANIVNNVAGDQTIHDGQHVAITSAAEARAVLAELRELIAAVALDAPRRVEATRCLEEMDDELARPRPDRAGVGERLRRVAEMLTSAGAVVTAGTALGTAITRLGEWLGPFGTAALSVVSV